MLTWALALASPTNSRGTSPLFTLAKNSAFSGILYSLNSPSSIEKPFFHNLNLRTIGLLFSGFVSFLKVDDWPVI